MENPNISIGQRIIYQADDGTLAIIIPWVGCGLSLDQIAAKDVPAGKLYKIVDVSELPTDRTARDKWRVDTAILKDGAGADYGVGSDLDVVEVLPNGDFVLFKSPVTVDPVQPKSIGLGEFVKISAA